MSTATAQLTTATPPAGPPLSRGDIDAFYRDGFIRRLRVVGPAAMAVLRERIDREVLTTRGANPKGDGLAATHCRHLDQPFLLDLIRSPVLVAAFQQLLGADLMLWSSNFWLKQPGATAVPWHQDIHYWPLNPPINLTAWMAIDRVTAANSCVQVIPGSHGRTFDHRKVAEQMLDQEAVLEGCPLPAPALLELEPGECAIFNERMLHHSAPNTSTLRRLGLGMRVAPPFVRVDPESSFLYPGHRCVMLAGEDRFGVNRMAG